MKNKKTIWAHTLFKNEERWLWFSVTSVVNYVDKVLLWDYGSTDKSWEIAKLLKKKYPTKIDLKRITGASDGDFPKIRQQMLDATKSDWFMVIDGDEIWWDGNIKQLVEEIKKLSSKYESVVVPNINLVGDVYHSIPNKLGKYKFGKLIGNYTLRAIKRDIPGLNSKGGHGVWGWADEDGKQIQERSSFKFINTPYLHTTFLPRGESREDDLKVFKRKKKLKFDVGNEFSKDYYYPESFFKEKPNFIPSPWSPVGFKYKLRAYLELPLKLIKRKLFTGRIGY